MTTELHAIATKAITEPKYRFQNCYQLLTSDLLYQSWVQLNLQFKGYGYIVEADIKGFFDNMQHDWLEKMLAQRIDDKALLSLIKQWLKSRVKSPDGVFTKSLSGTPQGGVMSPILANIYLHYVMTSGLKRK